MLQQPNYYENALSQLHTPVNDPQLKYAIGV